jgi:anthranilate/para-aminobenzoate synthase component I
MPPPRINLYSAPSAGITDWTTGFLKPKWDLRCDRVTFAVEARAGESVFKRWSDPLEALAWMTSAFTNDRGRWIGHLNYDFGRLLEPGWGSHGAPPDDLHVPLFHFTYCVPVGERIYAPEPTYATSDAPLRSTFARDAYEAVVSRSIDYIAAGDVFQVNLSQRFSAGLKIQPAYIHQFLVQQLPSHYGAYLGYGDYCIVSNSPELFLRVDTDRRITTRPIKGTRPLGDGMADELQHSTKDAAELNMIVDLERNDLGRVCEIGSVRVTSPRMIEAHPTVHHGVATIEGRLRDNVSFVELLRATFPGGSVTGAPKIRAMQIIDELEPVRRGPYCGAIGWLAKDGSMAFNLAIRTMIIKDGLVHIPVGGGIVADSHPAAEYEETLVKARAMFQAMGIAVR